MARRSTGGCLNEILLTGASASRNMSTASSFAHSIASEESLDESYRSAQVLFDLGANSEFGLDVSGELLSPWCGSEKG